MKKLLCIVLLTAAIAFISCKKTSSTDDSFDKNEMFTNYADNLIIPAYTNYGDALSALETALNAFNAAPDTTGLQAVQSAATNAYAAWQQCEIYEKTDPADAVQLLFNSNLYPVDTTSVKTNIQSGNNTPVFLENASFNQKGLPVLDYFFFSRVLSRTQMLGRFTTDANAASYRTYASSVVSELKRLQSSVLSAWTSSFRDVFINAIGTDAASSFSAMVNSISFRVDNFKLYQVGIPSGYVGNVATSNKYPEKVQAYYSNKSIDYMLASLNDLEDVVNGKSGAGLYDYLKHLNVSSSIGGNLADDIISQLDVCKQKVTDCGPDLAATILNDKPKADALFLEIKKLSVLLKVDVPSAIGVSISYTDNVGD
jgi:predicted lipoprotein